VWWSIITPLGSGAMLNDVTSTAQLQQTPEVQAETYLDCQQRYQLLEPLPPLQAEVQVRVLDCQPLQLSPLLALGDADSPLVTTIPAIAKAYLAIQSQLHSCVPAIHDAWQQDNIQVVLIEDRSDWQKLTDLWNDQKTTSVQILPWLYKMNQLWAALEPWHCRQSLLEVANLRVDGNQALVLQRLYTEPETANLPNWQDLGRLWRELFRLSQRTLFGSLVLLLEDLEAGNIQTSNDLQLRLEAIVNELQGNVTAAEVVPTPKVSIAPTTLQLEQSHPMQSDDLPTVMLPMQLFSLEDAGNTDVGRQRHHNEDYFGIETAIVKQENPGGRTVQARGLYILCDGMGGHAAGEVASALAVESLRQYFQINWQSQQLPDEATIRQAVSSANQAIYDENQKDTRSGTGRMGTTLVMVLIQDTKMAVVHVGDSRLYRISRKQGLEQVTVDHEVGQREISRGVEPAIAYARPDAYQLTQALGPRDTNLIKPDVKFLELNEDVLLILASDGLCDNDLLEQHWQTHLEPLLSSKASLESGVSNLIELANQYNGHDNITALLIRAKVQPDLQQHQKL